MTADTSPRDRRTRVRERAARAAAWLALVPALVLMGACASAPAPSPARFRLAPPSAHAPRSEPMNVEHYALDLTLAPGTRSFAASCRVRFVSCENGLALVRLDLEGLTVESVEDARGRPLVFRHDQGQLAIDLVEPLDAGRGGEVVVRYGGAPRKGLWFAAERDGLATQVFTQGECEDARWWFPCVDHPGERATSELRVTMPAGWRAVAAGERVERVEQDGQAIERWRMTFPHPSYLATLVAGELHEQVDAWEGLPLAYLAAPEHAERMSRSFAITPDVLGFLSDLTGVRYPFAKYSQACVADFPFGGMENVSATTLTDTTLDDERGARDATSHGLVVHEAAHQWFGDLLTCADWSEIWLNEGFASYLPALWFEQTEGVDALRERMRDVQDTYTEKDVGAARRPTVWNVYREPMDLFFDGQAYQGGAARLHLLRFVLGEQAFFRGVRLYVARNAGRSVRTDDLRHALEEASGSDLGWFFEQWLHKPGYPEFRVRWRHDAKRGRVYLAVNQVQDVADGTPAAFRTPVDVEIADADGRVSTRRLLVEERRHLFEIEAEREPRWVLFDPHGWIPKRIETTKGAEEWLALAADAGDVNVRRDALLALETLAGDAESPELRERFVQAIGERLATDARASVRARAAEVLGRLLAEHPSSRAGLERAATGDAEADVRVAALGALRSVGADDDLARLAREQFEQGYSWRTMAAAADLLRVAHRAPADLPTPEGEAAPSYAAWLERAMAIASPHGRLRSQLVDSLAALDDAAAHARLRELALDPAEPSLVRQAAARAIAKAGASRPHDVRDLLALLDERDCRLRLVVLQSLDARSDDALARGLFERYGALVLSRERRALEAAVAAGGAP